MKKLRTKLLKKKKLVLKRACSSTAEAIGLKGSSPTPPCSPVQPSKQLEYLARIQGFQV